MAIRITDPDTDPDLDPYRDTGKTWLAEVCTVPVFLVQNCYLQFSSVQFVRHDERAQNKPTQFAMAAANQYELRSRSMWRQVSFTTRYVRASLLLYSLFHSKWKTNKSSTVAEMGDRLATIHMGRKLAGLCPLVFRGDWAPSNTMSPGWGLPLY